MSLLILTSTVTVNSFQTKIIDPVIRLNQYVESILFYINSSGINKIIVCDNSNFDYSNIKILNESALKNKKQIEFLFFHGSKTEIQKFGKGYGEGEIMKYVLKNSNLFYENEISFLKITGRLKVMNLDSILNKIESNLNYFNFVNLNPFVDLKKVDTRFYQCTKNDFVINFSDCFYDVNDNEGIFLEHVYYNRLISNRIAFHCFNILPNFLGYSGSTGQQYKFSTINFLIRRIFYRMFNRLKR